MTLLRRIDPTDIARTAQGAVDPETLAAAADIVESVRTGGVGAVREYADRFGERAPSDDLVLGRDEMRAALDSIDPGDRAVLERACARIRAFADAQRAAILDVDVPIPGGRAGHTVEPIGAVGCYAPAGRYPLPSSVLMTAATARAAGCDRVVVAAPGADPVMLAAGAVADADEFLAVGGAHAVGALAHGFEGFAPVDKIVGPGNRWVTAAKQLVSGTVGIDMLAGPSELLVLADGTGDPALIAADLLAQAEHDTDARAILITTSADLVDAVDLELTRQLETLGTRDTAAVALRNGFACVARDLAHAIELTDTVAPEHLEIMTADSQATAQAVRHAGAVFIRAGAAEVLGDYGAGPNHTLPTGGTARFRAGLSVSDFVRLRTWIRVDDPELARPVLEDTVHLAGLEHLPGHARSAAVRLPGGDDS